MSKATRLHELAVHHHQYAATEHQKAAEVIGKDGPNHAFHAAMADHHAAMAECHQAECDASDKTVVGDVAKVSAVAPTIPPGVRAVLRPGQTLTKAADVPMEFQRFISLTSEEE
jgi:hypothetical protein